MSRSHSAARKTAVVTGATGAIGGAIARRLASAGFRLILPVRDLARAKGLPGEVVEVDLARRVSIDAFARTVTGPVHVLVNNAAECPRARQETPEGIERQLATNVLGYLWMTLALERALAATPGGRVVLVASYWAGGLDLDDLEFHRRRYDNGSAYRQAKQANRMLAAALADRLAPAGTWIGSCHPGDVNSRLSNALGFGGSDTPEEGADTPAWIATADDPGPSGGYYADRRPAPCTFSRDRAATSALYRALGAY
jgi:NAD(P)-dependent dehydrogenase (short-subunit alcohol dehydrogenase family)